MKSVPPMFSVVTVETGLRNSAVIVEQSGLWNDVSLKSSSLKYGKAEKFDGRCIVPFRHGRNTLVCLLKAKFLTRICLEQLNTFNGISRNRLPTRSISLSFLLSASKKSGRHPIEVSWRPNNERSGSSFMVPDSMEEKSPERISWFKRLYLWISLWKSGACEPSELLYVSWSLIKLWLRYWGVISVLFLV